MNLKVGVSPNRIMDDLLIESQHYFNMITNCYAPNVNTVQKGANDLDSCSQLVLLSSVDSISDISVD